MQLRFLGAVKGVTGSNHLIQFQDKLIMLDCGMFQGKDEDLNYEELQVNPADIDYLFLSHSHIDHSGRIPCFVKKGFQGKIYCSKPTYDLCKIMLLDSAHIQEMEAQWKNKKAQRLGKPLVEPLYTQQDAENSFQFFQPVLYDQYIEIDRNLTIRFRDAGHMLGSSIIEIWLKEEEETIKIVFSGDLGMQEKPILKDPEIIDYADYVIMESTYGNRVHKDIKKSEEEFIHIILQTIRQGGTVIIPSFAVGRTQEIIYELNKYYDKHHDFISDEFRELKKIPVYIDSPLAIKATEVFRKNMHVFDEEAKNYLISGDNPLDFRNLHFIQSTEESKALNFSQEPKIIISSSGMCDAGRIKHHLKHNLWKENCSIVFVGYQAEGTLGRKILDGIKDVKILGERIHIKAKIYNIEGFSGHADKNGLMNWLKNFKEKPQKVFIVHGETQSKADFAEEVEKNLGINCMIPSYNTTYEIISKTSMRELVEEEEKGNKKSIIAFKEKQISALKEEIEILKELFQKSFDLIEKSIDTNEIGIEEYKNINNKLLEIENNIMDLTILSGK